MFGQDPNDQANISGADLAILVDELKSCRQDLLESQAREAKLMLAIQHARTYFLAWESDGETDCVTPYDEHFYTPQDDAALREALAAAKREALEDADFEPSACSILTSESYQDGYKWGQLHYRAKLRRLAQEIKP